MEDHIAQIGISELQLNKYYGISRYSIVRSNSIQIASEISNLSQYVHPILRVSSDIPIMTYHEMPVY